MHESNFVAINEEGPREGFQIESASIPTADKVALIDALSLTGLREIQTVSFVNPKRVPSMADAEQVVAQVKPRDGVRLTGLYLNEQGLRRAIATGRLHIEGGISLCASAAFLQRNQNATPEQQRASRRDMIRVFRQEGIEVQHGSVSAAFGCNFEGEISISQLLRTVADVFAVADEFGLTLTSLGFSDTMAWATPLQIKRSLAPFGKISQRRDFPPPSRYPRNGHRQRLCGP